MPITIRRAEPCDAEVIVEMILELAEFEKLRDIAVITPESFRKNAFERGFARTLLAFDGDYPVGYAVYFFNFSTFTSRPGIYLEDLYVRPDYRKLGVGKMFFKELAKEAKAEDCARMEWVCLTWNENARRFYDKLGAPPFEDWRLHRMNEPEILSLAEQSE